MRLRAATSSRLLLPITMPARLPALPGPFRSSVRLVQLATPTPTFIVALSLGLPVAVVGVLTLQATQTPLVEEV